MNHIMVSFACKLHPILIQPSPNPPLMSYSRKAKNPTQRRQDSRQKVDSVQSRQSNEKTSKL